MDKKAKDKIEIYIKNGDLNSAEEKLIYELIDKIKNEELQYSKEQEDNGKDIYLAHYTSVGAIYSILENYKRLQNILNDYKRLKSIIKLEINKEEYEDIIKAEYKDGLRLYDAFSLNDPQEGAYLKGILEEDYNWLKLEDNNKDDLMETDSFLCSFVSGDEEKVGDHLKFWQSYGKDGLGCSIEIALNKLDTDNKILHRVLYGKKEVFF